jgi:hypothetical protein
LTAEQIKKATAHFTSTTEREVGVLSKKVVFCGLFTFTLTGRESAVISRPLQTFFRCFAMVKRHQKINNPTKKSKFEVDK